MPTRLDSREPYRLKGAGLSTQPTIRRARSAMSLLCIYGGQPDIVPDQRDHGGPDAAGAHATIVGLGAGVVYLARQLEE